MSRHWIDHVEDAEMQLEMAKAHSTPAKSLNCLYQVVVAITAAITELEKEREGVKP